MILDRDANSRAGVHWGLWRPGAVFGAARSGLYPRDRESAHSRSAVLR